LQENRKYLTFYKWKLKENTWEVDEFMGENEGLLLAKIEFDSENEPVELPQWIEKEISYDNRYFNSMLMKNPFRLWPR
jgi:adenylate cyclase